MPTLRNVSVVTLQYAPINRKIDAEKHCSRCEKKLKFQIDLDRLLSEKGARIRCVHCKSIITFSITFETTLG